MQNASYRDTWVEISLDAIQANVKAFKDCMRPKSKFMAVVKADGYGHGAVEVGNAALRAGADYLAVALLDEAIELRKKGIKSPILVLGYTGLVSPTALMEAIKNDITLTIFTEDIAKQIVKTAVELEHSVKVHIKIDSGMNRIGLRDKDEVLKLTQLLQSKFVQIEGIYTHFSDADNPDPSYTYKQFEVFKAITSYLEVNGIHIPIKHCCNSAATISYPEMHLDMVRVGISLYGLYPDNHLRDKITLKQAMSFKTKAVMIKTVESGNPISYGCTYTPSENAIIATIPVGYADGFSRSLSNKGHVTVNGKRVPIVGRICMDQSMIDITTLKEVNMDDEFVIFGDSGDGLIPLSEIADLLDTIHYEIVCLIGKRVPRVYIQGGQVAVARGLLSR
ncbi:alanine racemase [Oceanobacillus bengalensis]|uniref:Alanine racemase n=1 Tax=Oceanobacillus bengalensis TaxID=1435466 RepID=A0A494YSK3_9BACI|nr:alanine racemase [Oceanobacillus bengalensis]RKQ12870.1 alanine racemase [Oceanobacillus bengalensis]